MNVEVGKATASSATPASTMSEYITEHVTALMVLAGIESVSAAKYECGFGSRLHVSMAPFADAPEAVTNVGVVMKDALAQVMSVANIGSLTVKLSEDEMADAKSTWGRMLAGAAAENEERRRLAGGGSAQRPEEVAE